MRPEQVAEKHAKLESVIAAGAAPDLGPLLAAAKAVASNVRAVAAHDGTPVAIRVRAHDNRVRLTITGRRATKYRSMAQQALTARVPTALAEIRAQNTRRP